MSGFEIAGAVLGAIPLVISALESYKNGVLLIQRYRSYENEIQLLIRNINIERVRLQNVCEKLLDGLAPSSQIDAMVENPGGGLWMDEEIQKKIRARLWRSWDVFEQTLRDILVAITDISKRVGSGSDVRWSNTSLVWTELTSTAKKEFSSLLKKELKRAGFTLRRSTYEGLLATVEKDISKLESLASMDIKLEPKRRLRSRVRLLNILRSLSSSVYHAVFSSLTCACKHRISMRIPDYKDDLTPSHDDEYVIQKLQVHLTLSLPQPQLEESPFVVIDRQWEELIIRANPLLQTSVQTSNSVSDTGKTIVSSTKQKKSVKFSLSRLSSSFTTTMVQTKIPLVTSLTAGVSLEATGAPLPISNVQPSIDLCRELKESLATKRLSCLGIISDQSQTNTRSYSVFPSTPSSKNGNSWRIVSLKDSLESQSGQTPPTYKQRLRLAVFIARSALQFYKTPWLPEMPSNKDIFFFQDGSSSYFDRPFLMARSDKSEGKSKMTSEIQNPTLLAIGVLLIELLRGQTIESLRSPQEILEDGPLSLYTTASRLLTGVSQASSNYGTAVSRCIDGKIEGKDLNLENENDRHVIYCGVVSLLEEDLNNS